MCTVAQRLKKYIYYYTYLPSLIKQTLPFLSLSPASLFSSFFLKIFFSLACQLALLSPICSIDPPQAPLPSWPGSQVRRWVIVVFSVGKLVLMGGWDPASYNPVIDVFVYNFMTRRWRCGNDIAGIGDAATTWRAGMMRTRTCWNRRGFMIWGRTSGLSWLKWVKNGTSAKRWWLGGGFFFPGGGGGWLCCAGVFFFFLCGCFYYYFNKLFVLF